MNKLASPFLLLVQTSFIWWHLWFRLRLKEKISWPLFCMFPSFVGQFYLNNNPITLSLFSFNIGRCLVRPWTKSWAIAGGMLITLYFSMLPGVHSLRQLGSSLMLSMSCFLGYNILPLKNLLPCQGTPRDSNVYSIYLCNYQSTVADHFFCQCFSVFSRYGVHSFPSILIMNGTMRVRYRGSKDLISLLLFYMKTTGISLTWMVS